MRFIHNPHFGSVWGVGRKKRRDEEAVKRRKVKRREEIFNKPLLFALSMKK